MTKLWILTRTTSGCCQSCDVPGDTFFAAFAAKPTLSQLSKLFYKKDIDELDDEKIMKIAGLRRFGEPQDLNLVYGGEKSCFALHEVCAGSIHLSTTLNAPHPNNDNDDI